MGGYAGLGFPALAIKPPESPLQQFGQVENILAQRQQIAGEQQRQELGAVQLQEAQRDANSRATLMKIWADNDGDANQTVADARASGQVTPEHLQAFQIGAVQLQTQAALLQKDQLENKKTIYDMAANKLDAVKALPIAQRGQALMDAYGDLLKSGADPNDIGQHVQALVNNPSDDAITNYQTSIKGATWAADQQLKSLQLASTPTAAQAQQKNLAELNKAVSDSLIAQREYDNMPSPLEASTTRAAELLKTQSETAKNRAETVNAQLDAKMKGVKLVYATDANGQLNLLPIQSANALGMKVYMEAPSDAYANEKKSSIEIGSVQSGISEYRAAAQDPNLRPDSSQDSAMAAILSNNKLLGDLADKIPLGARMNDIATATQNAAHWDELDPQHQRLVAAYLTAKIGAANMQKLQGGSIGRNQEIIHAEFGAVPSPIQAGSPSFNEQVDAFQRRLDVASQGAVKVPGVRTPQEIRQDIESRGAIQAGREAAAQRIFQQNRTGQPAQPVQPALQVPGFRPPISTGGTGAGGIG